MLLQAKNIQKSYAAPVLEGIEFGVREGEIHALVGANGAGKSTLARIICGLTTPEGGRMTLGGQPYAPARKAEGQRRGVHMVMQELSLVGTLSVAENLFLGRMPCRSGVIRYETMREAAREALAAVGLRGTVDPRAPVATLGVGRQQLVEIAATLSQEQCRVLILDEPTAALTDPETDLLFDRLRQLRSEGVGLIYISHRLEEIRRIADRVTVLRDGRITGSRRASEVSVDEVARLMVGEEMAQQERAAATAGREDLKGRGERERGPVALRVEDLRRGDRVRGVSFEVRRGEILGLAGLVGAGRTETLRAVYGADAAEGGRVWRDPEAGSGGDGLLSVTHPRDAVRAGIGMIPEDRKQQGLLLERPLRMNATLAHLGAVTQPRGWIDPGRERRTAQELSRRLRVESASVEQPANELSGGNQQKVVLARWLLRSCEVLLFDEPTRGIDVGTKRLVYDLLGRLAREGKALVVVSSELRELMALCDCIAVMSAGQIAATFERGEWTEDRLMAAALGGHASEKRASEKRASEEPAPEAAPPEQTRMQPAVDNGRNDHA